MAKFMLGTLLPAQYKSACIDVAVALLTGNKQLVLVPDLIVGDNHHTAPCHLFESDIIPTNGLASKVILEIDDDDVQEFVPINGKFVEENFFVGIKPITSENGSNLITTSIQSAIESALNSARSILNDAVAFASANLVLNSDTGNETKYILDNGGELFCFVVGQIKETQSDDYDIASVLGSGWEYAMFDVETMSELAGEELDWEN